MVNKPKAIGTACETAVVRYLVANGFPGAERPALHGALDEGDITGTPGVAWEVKGGHAAENASDAQIALWLAEAEAERVNRGSDVAALVLKRKGKGAASAGSWPAYLPGSAYVYLATASSNQSWRWAGGPDPAGEFRYANLPPIRMALAELATLLRRAGYGDELEASA
jgi:hypothetical protein